MLLFILLLLEALVAVLLLLLLLLFVEEVFAVDVVNILSFPFNTIKELLCVF